MVCCDKKMWRRLFFLVQTLPDDVAQSSEDYFKNFEEIRKKAGSHWLSFLKKEEKLRLDRNFEAAIKFEQKQRLRPETYMNIDQDDLAELRDLREV